MIAPMKRAFVMVVEAEKRNAVRELRKLGLMHLEPLQGRGETYEELVTERNRLEKAYFLLLDHKVAQSTEAFTSREAIDFADQVLDLHDAIAATRNQIAELTNEIERVSAWGDFQPELLRELAGAGVPLRMVELPVKQLARWPEDYHYLPVATHKGRVKLLVLAGQGSELPAEALEFRPAESSLGSMLADRAGLQARLSEQLGAVKVQAARSQAIKPVLAKLDRDIAFETLHSGMAVDGAVAWFSGWVPAKDQVALQDLAKKLNWGLILDDPRDDENPPTKVENPAAVRMVQPVFDFLGTVPNYREYDISGLFLLFFAFFFAMIFGDGGYGALLFVAGLFVAAKLRIGGKKVPDAVNLLLFLSGATVVWGVITATWFGLPPESLPPVLRRIAIPWLSSENPMADDNVKVLCFCIGLVQLGIAHLKNFVRDWPSPRLLAQVGQLGMVGGIFFLVLNLVISAERYGVPMAAFYAIGIGFVLNFIFAAYDDRKGFFGGIAAGILHSLANIVSVFLGVVNIFADIVSYIRLWAVGLAGLAISQTVNNMAGPMLGSLILFAAGVLLLVFGHGLNLIMALLSVIVHGVRLNMLEFSGHLGMEWSGYKYEPFRDTAQNGQS